ELELCWGTVDVPSVVDRITTAAAAGFPCITVSPSQYLQFRAGRPGARTEIKAARTDTGVRIAIVDSLMGGLPGSMPPESAPPEYRPMFEITADDCIRILDEVGGEAVQVAHFLGE